jgi:hypothetical protein
MFPHPELRGRRAGGLWTPYTKPPFGSILIADHDLSQGLVGCWLFNEGGGKTVYDLSGKRNIGTLTNAPTWIADSQFGQTLSFDGVNDYVDLGTGPLMSLVKPLTVSLWVKPANLSQAGIICSIGVTDSSACFTMAHGFGGPSQYASKPAQPKVYTGSIQEGRWDLWTSVWNGDDSSSFYLSGKLLTQTGSDNYNYDGLRLGARGTGTYPYAGAIDGVFIYGRALSASEVLQLYYDPFCMFQVPSRAKYFYLPTGDYTLAVQDAVHLHSTDSIALTQIHNLALQELAHAHGLDSFALTQVHNLAVDELIHAHGLDAINLIQVHNLLVADLVHSHGIDSVAITQVHNLIIQELAHGHLLDAVVLDVSVMLAVQNLLHNHSTDGVNLTQIHLLAIQELIHNHGLENLTISQVHHLAVGELSHGHVLDQIDLITGAILAIADLAHGHSLDTIALAQTHFLSLSDLAHAHLIDPAILTQVHNLIVQELQHNHLLDNVQFSTLGAIIDVLIQSITPRRTIQSVTGRRTIAND